MNKHNSCKVLFLGQASSPKRQVKPENLMITSQIAGFKFLKFSSRTAGGIDIKLKLPKEKIQMTPHISYEQIKEMKKIYSHSYANYYVGQANLKTGVLKDYLSFEDGNDLLQKEEEETLKAQQQNQVVYEKQNARLVSRVRVSDYGNPHVQAMMIYFQKQTSPQDQLQLQQYKGSVPDVKSYQQILSKTQVRQLFNSSVLHSKKNKMFAQRAVNDSSKKPSSAFQTLTNRAIKSANKNDELMRLSERINLKSQKTIANNLNKKITRYQDFQNTLKENQPPKCEIIHHSCRQSANQRTQSLDGGVFRRIESTELHVLPAQIQSQIYKKIIRNYPVAPQTVCKPFMTMRNFNSLQSDNAFQDTISCFSKESQFDNRQQTNQKNINQDKLINDQIDYAYQPQTNNIQTKSVDFAMPVNKNAKKYYAQMNRLNQLMQTHQQQKSQTVFKDKNNSGQSCSPNKLNDTLRVMQANKPPINISPDLNMHFFHSSDLRLINLEENYNSKNITKFISNNRRNLSQNAKMGTKPNLNVKQSYSNSHCHSARSPSNGLTFTPLSIKDRTVKMFQNVSKLSRKQYLRLYSVRQSILNELLQHLHALIFHKQSTLQNNIFSHESFHLSKSFKFIQCAVNGQAQNIQHLLQINPFLVYVTDNLQKTALHWACQKCNHKMVESILQFCPLINSTDSLGRTPLYFAVQQNDAYLVKLLLRHRANPWSTNYYQLLNTNNTQAVVNYVKMSRKIDLSMKLKHSKLMYKLKQQIYDAAFK